MSKTQSESILTQANGQVVLFPQGVTKLIEGFLAPRARWSSCMSAHLHIPQAFSQSFSRAREGQHCQPV